MPCTVTGARACPAAPLAGTAGRGPSDTTSLAGPESLQEDVCPWR